ncbi:lysozyme inhibitor LprI family protein [Mangrovicella endophytica]|uniref:lysozyme inhibitor LprI family protein n=1 Tax=Mangrovicella endophytica TaxID=2066697 RepID=UPI0012FFFD38|nr:hypothetical protein [Mangrovicella endophytica]
MSGIWLKRGLGAAAVVAAGFSATLPAEAASFDCGKAASPAEKAVCASPLLSRLDDVLGKAYGEARKQFAEEAKTTSRDFMAQRASCATNQSCLAAAYVGVVERLGNIGATTALPSDVTAKTIAAGASIAAGALPQTLGQCAMTSVSAVHPRLGDGGPITDADYDSGTGIEYANGGYQVSYDREAALIASKPGDKVLMCLVWIPQGCPAGDDRGRFYMTTNLKSGATWTLADSQHMCGGA